MKKLQSAARLSTLAVVLALVFSSCRHEPPLIKHNFKVTLTTWYRVSPTAPSQVVVNGITYISIANLVVGGDGNATGLGAVKSYANTLSFSEDPHGPASGAIGAPVNEIPTYPVTGAPLPLIQRGDFAALPSLITRFHIPYHVFGHTVNLVLHNKSGDALFLSNVPGSGTSSFISPTVGAYTNKTLILGGAGKYLRATGELTNTGQFSFIAPYDGQDNYEGWIISNR